LASDIVGRKSAEPGTVDYVMPSGSSSIVKNFFAKSGVDVAFDHFVETVRLEGDRWNVTTKVT
jgi:predicted NAD/FAD-dependent oxidoreductase